MNVLVLVVDDEPDVAELFRQQFRRDLRAQRFAMDFASSAADALARIADTFGQSLILILSCTRARKASAIPWRSASATTALASRLT